jgi:protoporphyrinogen oxidase
MGRIPPLNVDRRGFITVLISALVAGWIWLLQSCKVKKKHEVKISGASHLRGHKLWRKEFPTPTEFSETDVLIVGGGISALSAARHLSKNSKLKITILEVEDETGGNSSFNENAISKYPLGAHYLPLPNEECTEILDFLKEAGICEGQDAAGLPVYNEYNLCFEPESRLYIHGHWQQGLIPHLGVPSADQQEIKRFLSFTDSLKIKKGKDGKFLFALPLDSSSADEEWRVLDKISFEEYLQKENYNSEYLKWFLEYCCRDDYGNGTAQISAWAGLHYFACRRGKAATTKDSVVLTWPEGNARLATELNKQHRAEVFAGHLAWKITTTENGVKVLSFDVVKGITKEWSCGKVIMATPQFVNAHLIANDERKVLSRSFTYSPWLIANLVVNDDLNRSGATLSWDNVIFGSDCLGYIDANHQDINRHHSKRVITYYEPLDKLDAVSSRKEALKADEEYWAQRVFNNLKKAHPSIRELCDSIEVWIWGHGMIRPAPGFIWGGKRKAMQKSINGKIFFAHSDLSGISIFEEAFYQGIRAADEVLENKVISGM